MWKAAEWGLSVLDMSDKKNATFDAHEAATFDVSESLKICKQLLEHSWQSYNNEHYHLVWQEALDTAIEGCKGLLTCTGIDTGSTYVVRTLPYLHWHLSYCSGRTSVLDQHNEDVR